MTAVAQPGTEQELTVWMKTHTVRGGGGLGLHVREWGKVDGPPIVFLHGWSQNHLCWVKQHESALADEFRLVACDLRGHGIANHLRALGVRRDDRLILMLGNQVELWESLLAMSKLGAVVIPATPLLGPADLVDRIERGRARHVITSAADTANRARPRSRSSSSTPTRHTRSATSPRCTGSGSAPAMCT